MTIDMIWEYSSEMNLYQKEFPRKIFHRKFRGNLWGWLVGILLILIGLMERNSEEFVFDGY